MALPVPTPPILRTGCTAEYFSPSNSRVKLFVNCANSDSNEWPWNFFWTKTLNTNTPTTTAATVRSLPNFTVTGSSGVGQTVLRAMFCYVATQSFSANVALSVSTAFTRERDNAKLNARLYKLDGSLVESFINADVQLLDGGELTSSKFITLPSTTCPLVLWLGASIQPTGEGQNKPLPSTSAEIEFSG